MSNFLGSLQQLTLGHAYMALRDLRDCLAWPKVWVGGKKGAQVKFETLNRNCKDASKKFKENCVYLRSCFEGIFRHENHQVTTHHIVHTDIQLQPVRRLSHLVRTSGPEGQGCQTGGTVRDDEQQYLCAGGHCRGAAGK